MRLTQITPFVPCTSLDRQVAFYRDVLGFTVGYQADNYAFLRRDAVAVRLLEVARDVDMKPALDRLAEGRVRPPFDQAYGQREFHVADEDCTLVFFGEPVRTT